MDPEIGLESYFFHFERVKATHFQRAEIRRGFLSHRVERRLERDDKV